MKEIILALDIGNVCVKINYANCFESLGLSAPPEKLVTLLRDYECGRISDEAEVFDRAVEIFDRRFSAAELKAAFNSVLIEAVPGMSELVDSFPEMGVKAVFFSDISPTHLKRTAELFPAFPAVTDGIFSFDAGGQKPSEAMFSAFERRFGVPDLYVDDRVELIAAAGERGWNSTVFAGAQNLREKLLALS